MPDAPVAGSPSGRPEHTWVPIVSAVIFFVLGTIVVILVSHFSHGPADEGPLPVATATASASPSASPSPAGSAAAGPTAGPTVATTAGPTASASPSPSSTSGPG